MLPLIFATIWMPLNIMLKVLNNNHGLVVAFSDTPNNWYSMVLNERGRAQHSNFG